ncbi:MAG: hypothetical protein Q8Q07_05305 [Dehalococcoidales bacterium]|nr:hypothetical protein [Dehalococcoidales bacterium]
MAWLQYMGKWLLTASPIPIRVTEVIVLVLTLVGLAVHQVRPQWVARMDKLVWQLPLSLLIAVLLISLVWSSYDMYKKQSEQIEDLMKQLEQARSQVYPSVASLMLSSYFRDVDVPLAEFGRISPILEGKTFENSRIHGPVVLLVGEGTTITSSSFTGDPEASFIVTTNKHVSGVLQTKRTTFINSRFDGVSFIGDQELIDRIKKGFDINP